jgi:hypothetical protein
VRVAGRSEEVAPFWGRVIATALTSEGLRGLMRAGWTTIKGALVMPLMAEVRATRAWVCIWVRVCLRCQPGTHEVARLAVHGAPPRSSLSSLLSLNFVRVQGFRRGLIKFVIITGKKP